MNILFDTEFIEDGSTVDLLSIGIVRDPVIECITQDPRKPGPAAYLAVCTVEATEIAVSTNCPDGECGGHPICKPCLDLALSEGLVRRA